MGPSCSTYGYFMGADVPAGHMDRVTLRISGLTPPLELAAFYFTST